MGFGMDIVAGYMDMSALRLETAYNTAVMKMSMDDAKEQAVAMIDEMLEAVPAPSQYNFYVYA